MTVDLSRAGGGGVSKQSGDSLFRVNGAAARRRSSIRGVTDEALEEFDFKIKCSVLADEVELLLSLGPVQSNNFSLIRSVSVRSLFKLGLTLGSVEGPRVISESEKDFGQVGADAMEELLRRYRLDPLESLVVAQAFGIALEEWIDEVYRLLKSAPATPVHLKSDDLLIVSEKLEATMGPLFESLWLTNSSTVMC